MRRETYPTTGGIGYVPVSPELREALRRRIAATSMRATSLELRADVEMLFRILDLGTATRRVAERIAVALGLEPAA